MSSDAGLFCDSARSCLGVELVPLQPASVYRTTVMKYQAHRPVRQRPHPLTLGTTHGRHVVADPWTGAPGEPPAGAAAGQSRTSSGRLGPPTRVGRLSGATAGDTASAAEMEAVGPSADSWWDAALVSTVAMQPSVSAPVSVPGGGRRPRTASESSSVGAGTPRSVRLRTISEHEVDDEPVELEPFLAEHRNLQNVSVTLPSVCTELSPCRLRSG